jgi:hypothetical protein
MGQGRTEASCALEMLDLQLLLPEQTNSVMTCRDVATGPFTQLRDHCSQLQPHSSHTHTLMLICIRVRHETKQNIFVCYFFVSHIAMSEDMYPFFFTAGNATARRATNQSREGRFPLAINS